MTAVDHRPPTGRLRRRSAVPAVSSTARNAWRHSFESASLPGGAASRPFHAERHEKDH